MKSLIFICLVSFINFSCNTSGKTIRSGTDTAYAIAYNIAVKDSAGKSNYEVFVMNMDGSNPRNITNHPDVAWTYRAYQKDLYFISDRDTCYRCFFLYKTSYSGANLQKISDLQLEDSWMDTRNNGKEMVVSGRIGKDIRYQLFLMNLETGTYKQITHDTAAMHSDPAFSPDGKKVAFVYKKNRRDSNQNAEVYLMDVDGTNLQQLTHYPQDNMSRNTPGYKAGATHWHPTENFISYISLQDGKHSIFAVTPDGKKQWKLTSNNFAEGWHDWSSDGQWLTFDMSKEKETQYHIMLMNWKTKEVKQLTDSTHKYQQSPVFISR